MVTKIWVNLPVRNLKRSVEFFTKLGYTFDARFTNESATCMVLAEGICCMLLVEEYFQTFTPKQVCDATTATEAIVCLSVESREEVDEIVARAVAAGAATPREPQDYGFMYGHGFEDLDGHLWEFVYMVPGRENEAVA